MSSVGIIIMNKEKSQNSVIKKDRTSLQNLVYLEILLVKHPNSVFV